MRPQGGGTEATVTRYRKIKKPGHPLAQADGQVYAHRFVLYEKIGSAPQCCHWCERPVSWFGPGRRIVADHLDGDSWNNAKRNVVPSCRRCNFARAIRKDFLTHCANGHKFTKKNTYRRPDGTGRQCRMCAAARDRVRRGYV